MLDITLFRENPEIIKDSEKKRFKKTDNVDLVIEFDNKWRKEVSKLQKLKSQRNSFSNEINDLKKQKKPFKSKILEVQEINKKIKSSEEKSNKLLEKRDSYRYKVGNILNKKVPISKDESGNKIERKWGKPKKFSFKPKHQADIILDIDGADLDRAAKLSGSRFYYLKNELAILNMSILRYAIDELIKEGFTPMQTPVFLRHEPMSAAAELSDFQDQLYKIEGEDNYLIATSEQTLASYHMNEVLNWKDLPIKYTAHSLCFRKEAGSHGKDTKGIFRVHQFDKIEQFIFSKPEYSEKLHEKMIEITENIFKGLEIPYRVVNVASGEMNDNGSLKYDIEGWFPAQNAYRELCSGTNCGDYQARKLNIKFDSNEGNQKTIHTLNCTAMASHRTIACLLENHQNKDGSINIPKKLIKYTGFKKIKLK